MSGPPVTFRHRPFDALTLRELHDLLRLRGEVFVVEQGISAENDLDGRDPEAVHVLGTAPDGEVVAVARVHGSSPRVVGRIAVRRDLRGQGVGTALLAYVGARLLHGPAVLSAQARLEGWYRRRGWTRDGPVHDEAGVPHVRMFGPRREGAT